MIRSRTTLRASLALAAVSALALGVVAPAQASTENPADPDFTAAATDIVGVGSDTSQILVDYLAEGHGDLKGYNNGKSTGRIASYAADGTPASVSLKGGAAIARINGSGAGKNALYTPSNPDVDFARSSSGPSTAEVAAGLQFFPFALDGLKIAVDGTTSNAPASIPLADLVKIYKGEITTWNQITGNAAGSTAAIKPLLPQSGSGTRTYFLSLLQAANGGVALTAPVGTSTQEHSDTDLKADPNALAPFSTARAAGNTNIKLVGGLDATRPLYNVVRGTDASSATNLSIFGKAGFICSADGRKLIEAAGFKQLAAQNRGGVCGVPTQSSTTNLRTADQAEGTQVTTSTLDALGSPSGTVELSATLTPVAAAGTVDFYEGDTKVGQTVTVAGGSAETTLTGVSAGEHTYTARFTPTDVNSYGPSTSEETKATVADSQYSGVIALSAPSTKYGAAKKVSVTIASGGNNATGSVNFVYASASSKSVALVNGKASFALPSTLSAGVYWGVVSYSGDANFEKDFKLVKLTVAKATTKTTLKITSSKVKVKKANKATVSVALTGSTIKANGKVALKIGSTTVGTGTVKNGKATVTIKSSTKTGKKSVKAYFTSSSANYGSSTSAAASFTVVK